MPETADILDRTAKLLHREGLHTGEQFAGKDGALDVCAAIYLAAEGRIPPEFYTDEDASLLLIGCSAKAMLAIQAISAVLDTEPCVTVICPGHEVPDYIEHVSHWAATRAPLAETPPTVSEVIGRILRAADHLDQLTAA